MLKAKVLRILKTTHMNKKIGSIKYVIEVRISNTNKKISCFCKQRLHRGDTIMINKNQEFLQKYNLANVGYVYNCTTTEEHEKEIINSLNQGQHDILELFGLQTNLHFSVQDILYADRKLNLDSLLYKGIADWDLPWSPLSYLLFGVDIKEIKSILETNDFLKEKLEDASVQNEAYYIRIKRELNNNGLIYYFLENRYKHFGDLCFPKRKIDEMIKEINKWFGEYLYFINSSDIKEVFNNNILNLFEETKDFYYLKGNYLIQEKVKKELNYLNSTPVESTLKTNKVKELTSEQNQALKYAVENRLSLLNGGPGTGKSFTVSYVANYLANNNKSVCVASLTARVAQKMEDTIKNDNVKCSTIHRLLNLNEFKKFNTLNSVDYNYVIIEEASMVNINLFKYLLTHLGSDTHLILVGDYNQLPSIGAGQIFRDLCKSKNVKKTTLTQIFRQATENSIVINSYNILKGKKFDDLKTDKNFYLLDTKDTKMADAGIAIVEQFLKQRNLTVEDVTILASTKSLANAINFKIQDKYNTNKQIVGCIYKVGDKVMQNINNKEKQVWNGNVGTVEEILEDAKGNKNVIVNFNGKRIIYNKAGQKELSLAYCYTVHKSQGMESDNVIIMIDENEKLMNRNLIYTAVTRAKETCVLVGKKENINNAIKNNLCNNGFSEIII